MPEPLVKNPNLKSADNFFAPHHVYIHFPYCLYKCHYCDFNSFATERSDIPFSPYTDALLQEMTLRKRLYEKTGTYFFPPGTQIDTIFLGGGTPSLFSAEGISRVLTALSRYFHLASDVEITLEANPGTIDLPKLQEFRAAGVNRISLGVQSLEDKYLGAFGRIHTGTEALSALDAALLAGFERVNADLIFGFPRQTLKEWQTDVATILKLGLKHLSCYSLMAEPGTIFTRDVKAGKIQETHPEVFADMLEWTHECLSQAGLPSYEISNFAKVGEESRHNQAYWDFHSYLGLGAGACGQNVVLESDPSVCRTVNIKSPDLYQEKIKQGSDFFNVENVDSATAMKEFALMGLRAREGLSGENFRILFATDLVSIFGPAITEHIQKGNLFWCESHLKPTRRGLFLNNTVVGDFFQAAIDSIPECGL